jgi:penicillin-binding protein 1C
MPSFHEVKDSYKKSDAILLDRHGKVLHELRVDPKGRRLAWTRLKSVSPALIKAIIHSEDKRFYEHNGVDWKAAGSAFLKNLFSENQRGASTISMQIAAILDKNLRSKNSRRSFRQKWNQINAAKELEKLWIKEEIIEAYLNLITFRGELQGISSASRGLFDKEPGGLNEEESLILAALIRAPNASIEDIAKRACVLSSSLDSGIRCDDIISSAKKNLTKTYSVRQAAALAPHAAHILLKNKKKSVVSTLDMDLQRFVSETLNHHLISVKRQNVNNGAALVVENKTGDILAYVANSGLPENSRHVDGIIAKRQAGSTLKPFLYAVAFEKKLLTAASILSDSPLDVPTEFGIYKPENYEKNFRGKVTARTALGSSLNIPAVRTLDLIGVDAFVHKLVFLGFGRLKEENFYGLSVALGSADVSLYELVNAYRSLANNGVSGSLRMSFNEKNNFDKQVITGEAAFIISDILSDREARSATFDLENPLSTRFRTAVKTGTSKDMRDNWCVGYSDKYTVGVWVGNFTGEPMWNVSGITGAAPVWLDTMNYLHKTGSGEKIRPPDGLVAKKIRFEDKIEPERTEWFIKGTEPADITAGDRVYSLRSSMPGAKIIYPAEGTVIALDPDIPEEQQLVIFESENSGIAVKWVLNNKPLDSETNIVSWKPQAGSYKISIVDMNNKMIDSVKFQVRGN